MGNSSVFALFSSASNRVFPLRPQELHQHTAVMSELHPLAASNQSPAHQVWTGVSSPRPGRRLRPASAPAGSSSSRGQLRQDAGPLSGRQAWAAAAARMRAATATSTRPWDCWDPSPDERQSPSVKRMRLSEGWASWSRTLFYAKISL